MSVRTWAESEIALAKKNADKYYTMCLDAAKELIDKLCDQGHSGFSMGVTMQILNALANGNPLSPIEDTDDVWSEVGTGEYQCKRCSGLFKSVHENGKVTYSDANRFICHEVDKPDIPFHNGFISRELDKIFPITFPYYPEKYKVTVKEELFDPANGDFDTITIISVRKPNGDTVDIWKYYTEIDGKMTPIDQSTYYGLGAKQEERQ